MKRNRRRKRRIYLTGLSNSHAASATRSSEELTASGRSQTGLQNGLVPKRVTNFIGSNAMQLKVTVALERAQATEEDFFQRAYVYIYGCTADLTNDIVQWKLHGIVPYYLSVYCDYYLEQP